MRSWIATLALLLPFVAGIVLTDLGARLLYGIGLIDIVSILSGREIGEDRIAVAGMWFLAACGLLGAGALLSIVCSNTMLMGGTVVPHCYLGADLMGHGRYVAEDDLDGPPVTVARVDAGGDGPTYGFGSIYRRHLLIADASGRHWQRLLALTTRNLMWPAVAAPAVYAISQVFAWAPLIVAADNDLPLKPEFTGGDLPLPLLLFGDLGRWVGGAVLAIWAVLLPLARRTGRWTRRTYARLDQPYEDEYPRCRPLPEAVRPGGTVQGRIVDAARRAVGKERRRSDRLFLVEFDEPFVPAVRVGFRFREGRNRRAFIEYLEGRMADGHPVRFEVAGAGDLQIVPRDAAGGPPPAGVADDIRGW